MADPQAPLISAHDMVTPYFLKNHDEASRAGLWRAARSTPRTEASLVGWAWRASRPLTLATGALELAGVVVATFGLLATADVFGGLLAAGPAPSGSWPRCRHSRWWSGRWWPRGCRTSPAPRRRRNWPRASS